MKMKSVSRFLEKYRLQKLLEVNLMQRKTSMKIESVLKVHKFINHLLPSVPLMACSAKILISITAGFIKQ